MAAVVNRVTSMIHNHYRFNSPYVPAGLILSDQVMQAF